MMASKAIFGDLLWGSSATRFVFIDEAGTSETEPVTVVVGLIVNADQQLMFAEAAVSEAIGAVPKKFREGFVFHATEVWSNTEYREAWAMPDRLALLTYMMSLPRRLQIPICLSMVRRTAHTPSDLKNMTTAQFQHFQAFAHCIARADRYIRDRADLREVGTVVAEDVPEMRKFLKLAPQIMRDGPGVLPPGSVNPTEAELKQGYITQRSDVYVSRIRRSIHFVEKGDDPLLQLADACAFAFRRYFAEQSFGKEFLVAVIGEELAELAKEDFTGASSNVFLYDYQQRRS